MNAESCADMIIASVASDAPACADIQRTVANLIGLVNLQSGCYGCVMAGRRVAPKKLRDRIESAIDEGGGIVAVAKRLGVATNTLYRIYRGESVNATTITAVEARL